MLSFPNVEVRRFGDTDECLCTYRHIHLEDGIDKRRLARVSLLWERINTTWDSPHNGWYVPFQRREF